MRLASQKESVEAVPLNTVGADYRRCWKPRVGGIEHHVDKTVAVVDGKMRTVEGNWATVIDAFIKVTLVGTYDNGVGEFEGGMDIEVECCGAVAEEAVGVELGNDCVGCEEGAIPSELVACVGYGVYSRRGSHVEHEAVEAVALEQTVDMVHHVLTGLVVEVVEEGEGLVVADGGIDGVEDGGRGGGTDAEVKVEAAVAPCSCLSELVVVENCGSRKEEGVGVVVRELRGAEVDGVEVGEGWIDVE